MTETASFADRMHERYPEGLTGIFAPGGTRTNFLLEHQRNQENPGQFRMLLNMQTMLSTAYSISSKSTLI